MSILEYVRGVFWTWMGLVAGVVMLVIGLYERMAKKPLSKLAYAGVLVVLLLVSPYYLWMAQREALGGLRSRVQAMAVDSLAQRVTRDSLEAEIARGPGLALDKVAARDRATRDRLGAFVKEGNAILTALVGFTENIDATQRKAETWTTNVDRYLLTCEDKTYEPEFVGAVVPRLGTGDPEEDLRVRLRVLQKFIDGLRDKRP